jgi:hypothetical protein
VVRPFLPFIFACLFMGFPPIGRWITPLILVLYWVNCRWAREERWAAYIRNECALYIEEVLGVT